MITVNPIQKLVVWVPVGGCEEMISYLFEARAELTRTAAWRQCWLSALGRVVYTMVLFFCQYIYIYIYIYICIGIVWLRAPNESRPFHSSWTRTLLGGVWNVHNFLQTWTTSMNSMTSSQTLQRAINQTIYTPSISLIHTYIYTYYTKHLKHEVRSYFILQGI